MADEVAFSIAANLLTSLGSNAIEQIGLAWGVTEELERLTNIVSIIKGYLLDAEQQQMSNGAVREWLQRLKEILWDADDLLDEVAIETKRKELETDNRLVRKVCYFFTPSNRLLFRRKVGSEIKDILKRLGQINSQIREFGFEFNMNLERPIETITWAETTPQVYAPSIIGRDRDKEAIVDLLLNFGNQENVVVIPIVGIGGLGKTTLAQLVYGDDRIKTHFGQRLWVCVSTDFDIEKLLIKILKAGRKWDEKFTNNGIQMLEEEVIRLLSADKFLLFLDDVWNKEQRKWNKLENLLKIASESSGARGSKIVVTTCSTTVASIVRTSIVPPYRLIGLSNEECLELLVKWAFKGGERNRHENLVNIGREIVKNCGGVPLAVVTLGSLLSSKREEQYWLFVRDNEAWGRAQEENGILPALRLSYDQMPSHLKHCFAYCSLFERDEIIDGKKLLYAWMAQGFIQRINMDDELEDIGKEYIVELVSRFFLEPYDGQTTGREHYKMHSLVHSLAREVAGDEYMTIKGKITREIPRMLRHVAFDSKTYSEFPKSLMEAKKLRTIFFPRKKIPVSGSSVETGSTRFRHLRVCDFEDMISSPKKIRKLKLLRYLSLHQVDKLPKSLSKLLNLQYLDFSVSEDLNKLPKALEKLGNLRFLCLSSTTLTRLPNKGLRMLTSLRTLIIFDCQALRSLDEWLEHLPRLRELALVSCTKLISLPADLSCLTSLERLEISNCLYLTLSDNDLKGLKSLKQLQLRNLPIWLVSLPEGLLDAAGTLTHLEIESCMNFTSPSESVLPKLKLLISLKIWNCEKVDSLPEGIRGLRLQSVSIVDCPDFTTKYERRAAESRKIAHVPEIEVKNRLSV